MDHVYLSPSDQLRLYPPLPPPYKSKKHEVFKYTDSRGNSFTLYVKKICKYWITLRCLECEKLVRKMKMSGIHECPRPPNVSINLEKTAFLEHPDLLAHVCKDQNYQKSTDSSLLFVKRESKNDEGEASETDGSDGELMDERDKPGTSEQQPHILETDSPTSTFIPRKAMAQGVVMVPQRTYFQAILEPNDGEPLDPSELLYLPNLSLRVLDEFVYYGNQLRSRAPIIRDNVEACLKFLARYRLLGNTQKCDFCLSECILKREHIDTYYWKCPKCCECSSCPPDHQISITRNSFFEYDPTNLRVILRLMAKWCDNPGENRVGLSIFFGITQITISNLQKNFAGAGKIWWIRRREGRGERIEMKHEVKSEQPDEPSTNPEAFDVTTLFSQTFTSTHEDQKNAVVLLQNEKKDNKIDFNSYAMSKEEIEAFFKEHRGSLMRQYKVASPFPQVFIYDYIFRQHFGCDGLMNRLLYEITQIWDVDTQSSGKILDERPVRLLLGKRPADIGMVEPKEEPLLKMPKVES